MSSADTIVYVGAAISARDLVREDGAHPWPTADLALSEPTGDVTAFTIAGTTITATRPGVLRVRVRDAAADRTAIALLGATVDLRRWWQFSATCQLDAFDGSSHTLSRFHFRAAQVGAYGSGSAGAPSWTGTDLIQSSAAIPGTMTDTAFVTYSYKSGTDTIARVRVLAEAALNAAYDGAGGPLRVVFSEEPTGRRGLLTLTSATPVVADGQGWDFCGYQHETAGMAAHLWEF